MGRMFGTPAADGARDVGVAVLGSSACFAAYALSAELLRQQPIDRPLRALAALALPLLVAPGVVAVAHASADESLPGLAAVAVRSVKVHAALLAVALAVLAGLLVFVVPGIVAAVLLVYAVPAAAVDGAGPVAAVRRSLTLTKRRFWHSLGVLAVLVLAHGVAAVLAGAAVEGTSALGAPLLVGVALGGSLAGAVLAVAVWWLVRVYDRCSRTLVSGIRVE